MRIGPIVIGDAPLVMGIINVTPDSFSDGGRLDHAGAPGVAGVVAHARRLVREGASILDVGGESTRPGAQPVSANEELRRVVPVMRALAAETLPVALSIDTRKAEVARAALEAGAHLVNDVSALADPEMAATIAHYRAAVVLMHMRGEPQTMQSGPIHYDDVTEVVVAELTRAVAKARAAGIDRILVDPGIGFGKTPTHNLRLTKTLEALRRLGPVVYGASRKRFLGDITGNDVDDRDRATAAISAIAVMHGASVLRVHDVAACIDALKVATAVRDA